MKSLTAPGQYRAGREFATSDADAALQPFVLTYEVLLGFIGQGHQFFRAAQQQRAFVGQGNYPCSPLHELYARFLLQHGQLAGQGWLRNMQHFRRTGNVLLPNDGQKITKNRSSIRFLPPCHPICDDSRSPSFVNIRRKSAAFVGGWRGVCCMPINRRAGRVTTAGLLRPYGKAMVHCRLP